MRFLTVTLGCSFAALDSCSEISDAGDDTITSLTISLDGRPAREIDVCTTHRTYLVDNMLKPLMADGRAVEGAVAKKQRTKKQPAAPAPAAVTYADVDGDGDGSETDPYADVTCQVEGCARGRLKSRTGLAQHCIKAHGFKNLDAYYQVYPPLT